MTGRRWDRTNRFFLPIGRRDENSHIDSFFPKIPCSARKRVHTRRTRPDGSRTFLPRISLLITIIIRPFAAPGVFRTDQLQGVALHVQSYCFHPFVFGYYNWFGSYYCVLHDRVLLLSYSYYINVVYSHSYNIRYTSPYALRTTVNVYACVCMRYDVRSGMTARQWFMRAREDPRKTSIGRSVRRRSRTQLKPKRNNSRSRRCSAINFRVPINGRNHVSAAAVLSVQSRSIGSGFRVSGAVELLWPKRKMYYRRAFVRIGT